MYYISRLYKVCSQFMMILTSAGLSFLLVVSVCFPVVKLMDVYEDSINTLKEKPVSRHYHNSWYTQPTPRLGKRRLEEDNDVYHTIRCQPPYDYPEYEVKDKGCDLRDTFYKTTPHAQSPGREAY